MAKGDVASPRWWEALRDLNVQSEHQVFLL